MHTSAGAVVFKKTNNRIKILLMYRQKTDSYHLPKGTQRQAENLRQTAVREIKEETGCQVILKKYLGKLSSAFKKNKKIIPKETHYFLAEFLSSIDKHDREHDKIIFVGFKKALVLLKTKGAHIQLGYEDEQKIIKVARRFENNNEIIRGDSCLE